MGIICCVYEEEGVIRVSTLRGEFRDLYRKEGASDLVTLRFSFPSFFFFEAVCMIGT
jgi:hypothetical protein